MLNNLTVFSESTATALSYYSSNHPHVDGTGNFITCMNNLWKVMSLKSPLKGNAYLSNCVI